jgi:hypothetical protein
MTNSAGGGPQGDGIFVSISGSLPIAADVENGTIDIDSR